LARRAAASEAEQATLREHVLNHEHLVEVLESAGAKVVRLAGCPAFTLAVPVLVLLSLLHPALARGALRACEYLDRVLEKWVSVSLYVSYEFRKEDPAPV
jgi:hypothetical protein